jgi:predicted Zn-dependent protease
MKAPRIIYIALAALMISLSLAGCKQQPFANHYSTDQENALGQQIAAEVESQNKIDMDPEDNTRVERVAQPIFDQARKARPDVTYQIKIIQSPEVNAFSLPGGWIYVYTGLLDKVGNDDDALACVIGHECSHVVLRHVVKQISDEEDKGTLLEAFGVFTGNYNAYNLAQAAVELQELHFSRQDEYQADQYGLKFAYNAGFDPYGMPRFFQKLETIEKEEGSTPAWAEDHPITKNRILRANQLIEILRANDGNYPPNMQVDNK